MIHTGDCIEVMRGMEADSVDAVVTDPPYALEFMGKGWDKFGAVVEHPDDGEGPWGRTKRVRYGKSISGFQEWCEAWGREALRVTKPGGYLLAFGGTRTHHRLVCGLEDAGWIIRDELDWIYASGFPKGKANLKPAHEPIVLARKPGPLRPLNIEETRIGYEAGEADFDAVQRQGAESTVYIGGAKPGDEVQKFKPAGRWPSNLLLSDPELFDEPNPYVVGSGATNVGGGFGVRGQDGGSTYNFSESPRKEFGQTVGYGDSGGYSRFFLIPKADRADREPVLRGQLPVEEGRSLSDLRDFGSVDGNPRKPDTGHIQRRSNVHPTVKPVDLMRHLIRLVTPPGGTVLDPFLGSGSTAIAAELEGFPWIGIEKEPEYVAIAEARLNGTQRGLGLDTPLVGEPRKSVDGVAVRHNSGGNTFGGDKPKPPMPDMTYRSKPVREPAPLPPGMFDEEPAA